jgi:microcystin-dependent protein
MDAYLSQVWLFAFNFAPRGYLMCAGQILSIQSNTALFSLLGTTFGGNGTSTFGLPDLRGRVPVGSGQGPGLAYYQLGQIGGTENLTLMASNLPVHTHSVVSAGSVPVANTAATSASPAGNYYAISGSKSTPLNMYAASGSNAMAPNAGVTGVTGASQGIALNNPYVAMTYCICTQGLYPSRN